MFDGNKFDVTIPAQQNRLPFEDMGNILLEAMQGTLVCLDNQHIIVDVSKTMKEYFGFEQTELIGLSILLLIEDSERDSFFKFLNNPSQSNDMSCVRMMTNNPTKYHQVKIHRKKKFNQDNVDVHSTTPRHSCSIGTILLITIDESTYIDISLYDIHKEEFFTKLNLIGEITFEDHRGASITGYLPHELVSQSIFNLVHHDDRLVKLHALWKCMTTGSSKVQWRLIGRDGNPVYLQTEYKLIADSETPDSIIARNEVLNPTYKAQFDDLQTAWRHQCAADIKGNNSSFKLISSSDSDLSYASNEECRICVPSLSMCFIINKLQPADVQGSIFDVYKSTRPLTIQDYIDILIDHDKHIDSELAVLINNIQSLTARYRRANDLDKAQGKVDQTIDEKPQPELSLSPSIDTSPQCKQHRDSIVRGILSSSIKCEHEKPSDESSSIPDSIVNGNKNNFSNGNPRSTTSPQLPINPTKPNSAPLSPNSFLRQHIDFLKKYNAAKAKLKSQLDFLRNQESINGPQIFDINRRNIVLNKLYQLENIKNKHLARQHDFKQQATTTTAIPIHNLEQKDFLTSLFTSPSSSSSSSPSSNSMELLAMDNDNHNTAPIPSAFPSSSFYPHQGNSSQQFDPGQTPSFNEFFTPSSSSFSSYLPVQNTPHSSTSIHSYSYQSSSNLPSSSSSLQNHHQHNATYPY